MNLDDDWLSSNDCDILLPVYECMTGNLGVEAREFIEDSDAVNDSEYRTRMAGVFKSATRLFRTLCSQLTDKLHKTSYANTKRATPVVSPRTRARRSPARTRTKALATDDDDGGGDGSDSDPPPKPYSPRLTHKVNRSRCFFLAVVFPRHMSRVLREEAAA